MSDKGTTYAEAYPGNYLEACDLLKPVEVVIESVDASKTEKAADGRVIDKPIVRFKGAKKALICNKTNMKRILMFYAQPVKVLEELVGVKITIGTEVSWNPRERAETPCVRVMIPKGGAK